MCIKNVNAIGVIILFLSAFIGQCQGGKRKLKHAKSVSYETDDTSSDSREDKGTNMEDLAAKILLNSEDTEESWNNEKKIKDGYRNEDMAHKDFANKHYLIQRNGKESSKEDEIIRGNPDKNIKGDVAPKLKNLVTKNTLNPKDDIKSSHEEKIIRGDPKSNSNEDVLRIHKVAITHMNLADRKKTRGEEEVIRGNPKIKFNERVPSKHEDLAERTDLNLDDTKESIREDEIVRGNIKSKFNERVPSKHEDLAAETRLNLEDTNESIREYEIVRGNPEIKKFNERLKHKDLAEKTVLNLADTKESIREDGIVKGDINSKMFKRVPMTHKDLASETRLNLEDTQEPIRKDEIVTGDTKIKFNVPSKHKDLAERTDLNLEDTQESIREDEMEKADTKIKLNMHDDAIELRGKDQIVKGEESDNPGVDEKVLTIHLTNEKSKQNKDHKPILSQRTPPVIIRAQGKVSNSTNPVSNESSSEDDGTMERDIKKAKVLRKAYGDACFRVVLRKCLKAMKSTLKAICKSSGKKCKREFKDDFKQNSITGCYMQFDNKSTSRVGNDGAMATGAKFGDSKRTLSMTCLRTLSDTAEESETAVKSEIVDPETRKVNILRDRYEKACQKSSYGKCCAAGKYASDTTCEKNECSSNKKKAIRKTYKKHCLRFYAYVKSDKSSSSSGSSSE